MAFNSAIYGWKDIEVRVGGSLVTGIQNVRFDSTTQKEFVYGSGTTPLALKSGNEGIEGSITLLQGEYEALAARSPNGQIRNLRNVSIQVAFSDENANIVSYSINGVGFTREGFDSQQGQTSIVSDLPFMALGVVVSR